MRVYQTDSVHLIRQAAPDTFLHKREAVVLARGKAFYAANRFLYDLILRRIVEDGGHQYDAGAAVARGIGADHGAQVADDADELGEIGDAVLVAAAVEGGDGAADLLDGRADAGIEGIGGIGLTLRHGKPPCG